MSSDREQWRLKGFSASVCHFQSRLLPLLLCFFLSAASQLAAEGKTGKLPKEARAAQPPAPPSLATPSPDDLAKGPGPFIQASRFVSSPHVWRVWLTTALSSWPDPVGPCLSLNLENCSAGSEVPAVTTPVNCVSISSPEDCQTPRGTSRDPNIYPPFPEPEEARERESFSAASQRLRWGKTHQPGHGLSRRLEFPAHVVGAQPLNV